MILVLLHEDLPRPPSLCLAHEPETQPLLYAAIGAGIAALLGALRNYYDADGAAYDPELDRKRLARE